MSQLPGKNVTDSCAIAPYLHLIADHFFSRRHPRLSRTEKAILANLIQNFRVAQAWSFTRLPNSNSHTF